MLFFGESVNPAGSQFSSGDLSGPFALPSSTGIVVDTGNVSSWSLQHINSRLTNISNRQSGEDFVYVADDGTNTTVFTYQDDNNDALVQESEIDFVVSISNVESTALTTETLQVVLG